jgi:HlyD family secretion protein
MSTELFRKSALATLSSPEQLDQLMKITRPRSWIALSVMALVLVVAILWSVLGSLPTSVAGNGIIMRKGGIFNIVATGNGSVSDLQDFKVGDKIKKGQILGHVAQPVLEQQIREAKANLGEENIASAEEGEMQLKVLHAKEEQLRSLKTTEQQQAELLRDGLITRQRYEETRQAIYATQNDIAAARVALQKLPVQQTKTDNPLGDRVSLRISQAVNRLNELQLQYQLASNIVSTLDGIVVETMAMNGDAVKDGQTILSIEAEQKILEVTIYLPPGSIRKLVKPGMTAQISPATSKKERYGYLVGKVLAVSEYPATEEGMMNIFHNAALVREVSKDGPPIAVLVEFIPDHQTRSGYAWSSAAGAGVEVTSGTLCAGNFVVENKRPISLVIPMLKETIGL